MPKKRQNPSSNSLGAMGKPPVEITAARYALIGTIITALLGLLGVSITAYFTYLVSQKQAIQTNNTPQTLTTESAKSILPTSIPTTNPPNTQTPHYAFTPMEILQNAKTWALVYSNSFDSDDGKWAMGEYNESDESGNFSISNGKYLWKMKTKENNIIRAMYPAISPIENFYLSVDINLVNGSSETTSYGLVFRGSGYSFYTFRLGYGTNYVVQFLDGNWNWRDLISHTAHSAIKLRNANRLQVIGDGSHFMFFINDEFVGETEHSRFPSGNIGIANTVHYAGDEVLLEFDNFEIHKKP